ncbi:hypothetical protein AMECASPLE_019069 [Ameca splendens]|uniref:Uncharacterized protein n=1 Tax=Ameca splendens TaxID=208324 RepID=A0ABV1ABX3_9TELE
MHPAVGSCPLPLRDPSSLLHHSPLLFCRRALNTMLLPARVKEREQGMLKKKSGVAKRLAWTEKKVMCPFHSATGCHSLHCPHFFVGIADGGDSHPKCTLFFYFTSLWFGPPVPVSIPV